MRFTNFSFSASTWTPLATNTVGKLGLIPNLGKCFGGVLGTARKSYTYTTWIGKGKSRNGLKKFMLNQEDL